MTGLLKGDPAGYLEVIEQISSRRNNRTVVLFGNHLVKSFGSPEIGLEAESRSRLDNEVMKLFGGEWLEFAWSATTWAAQQSLRSFRPLVSYPPAVEGSTINLVCLANLKDGHTVLESLDGSNAQFVSGVLGFLHTPVVERKKSKGKRMLQIFCRGPYLHDALSRLPATASVSLDDLLPDRWYAAHVRASSSSASASTGLDPSSPRV